VGAALVGLVGGGGALTVDRPLQSGAMPVVALTGGTLEQGLTREAATRSYEECLAEVASHALCGDSFEASVFARASAHRGAVRIRDFELDRYEVTNGAFVAWLNTRAERARVERDPARLAALGLPYPVVVEGAEWLVPVGVRGELVSRPDTAIAIVASETGFEVEEDLSDLPVRMVSWQAAALYCAEHGKRLPSGAEWEWAARGRAGRTFPWGEGVKSCAQAVYDRSPGRPCAPPAAGPPGPGPVGGGEDVTPEGVHDLAGNVSEWVADAYGGPDVKMVRGGHYLDALPFLSGANVYRAHRAELHRQLGFRCASAR
jgi:formylglycine-generating enzyme required for sulfatase activity